MCVGDKLALENKWKQQNHKFEQHKSAQKLNNS